MWTISLPLSVPVSKKKNFSLNLNIYRNAHYLVLNKAKTVFTSQILSQLRELPKQSLIGLTYNIFLPNQRKADISNIGSVTDKFFSDALVEAGVIPDDNYTYLRQVQFFFGGVDRVNPRVDVTITPIQKEPSMKIILTQDDLQSALKTYISSKIIIQDDQEVTIEINDDGVEVIIGETGSQEEKSTPRRTRRTKAEMEAARQAELDEEEANEVLPDPVSNEVESAEPVEETEQEEKPKAKSLFGGLNRPKN